MVDGCLLLVDAAEGPLPQTRFVLRHAMQLDLKIIVVVNKIDRADARAKEVLDEIYELFLDLDAKDHQIDFPVVYTNARKRVAVKTPDESQEGKDLRLLFDTIVEHIPGPKIQDGSLQMMISNTSYNDYLGRLAVGKIHSGTIRVGDKVVLSQETGVSPITSITALFAYEGMEVKKIESASAGDIAIVAGIEELKIGDSIMDPNDPRPLPRIKVEEPTISIQLIVNTGPFAGRDGDKLTSRALWERMERELRTNVSLQAHRTNEADTFLLRGRGELQFAVLAEQMRREGYELAVSKPEVIFKMENGQKMEPMEMVMIDADEEYAGVVIEKMGLRKGEMTNMETTTSGTHLEFRVPSRGLIGYRNEFLTDTRGTGTMNTLFDGYEAYKGEIESRNTAVMVSTETGKTVAFALFNLQERGQLILGSGVECYAGMIIGRAAKDDADMDVNPCKEKKLTNVRNKGAEEAVVLTTPMKMTLERAIEFIGDDELVEVTPESIRLRKAELDPNLRKRKSKVTA
jgi:GTP-binding protein